MALALVSAVGHAHAFPGLDMHGTAYASGCAAPHWAHTQGALEAAAQGRQPRGLVALVRVGLCQSGAQANAVLRKNALARIPLASAQTGVADPISTWVARASLTALGGAAWGVTVEGDGGSVTVAYYPNAACAAAKTFAFQQNQWWLVSLREACD